MRMTKRFKSATVLVTVAALVLATGAAEASVDIWSLCLAGLERVTPADLWRSWSFAPAIIVPLLVLLAVYLHGMRNAKAGEANRRAAFFAGWVILVVALVSPLCRLAATLVSAHMVQFMLLVTLAPLLIALARPETALFSQLPWTNRLPAVPRPGLSALTVTYGLAIWLWHAPAVYTLLLTNPLVHVMGLGALVLISTLFWRRILATDDDRRGHAIAALLTTMVHTGLLGALLTFGTRPFYAILAPGALDWGLTPLQDQQLAGLVMWVPGGMVYMAGALALCLVWLRRLERTKSVLNETAGNPLS